MSISVDVSNIINKYIPQIYYAGYIIIRYKYGYIPNHEDNPLLIVVDTNKYNVLNKLIEYCQKQMELKKFVCGHKYVIIGIHINKLKIGSIIKQIEWNNCQGYFVNSPELDRNIKIDQI